MSLTNRRLSNTMPAGLTSSEANRGPVKMAS